MEIEESKQIAKLLASRFLTLQPEGLSDYIDFMYPNASGSTLSLDHIYVVQVEQGNIKTGDISSNPVRWWHITGGECLPIQHLEMGEFNVACDNGRKLWLNPILKFYSELPHLLTVESFGPTTRCKRLLNISTATDAYTIREEQVLWKQDI